MTTHCLSIYDSHFMYAAAATVVAACGRGSRKTITSLASDRITVTCGCAASRLPTAMTLITFLLSSARFSLDACIPHRLNDCIGNLGRNSYTASGRMCCEQRRLLVWFESDRRFMCTYIDICAAYFSTSVAQFWAVMYPALCYRIQAPVVSFQVVLRWCKISRDLQLQCYIRTLNVVECCNSLDYTHSVLIDQSRVVITKPTIRISTAWHLSSF